jgi:chromosome segregation ATPase
MTWWNKRKSELKASFSDERYRLDELELAYKQYLKEKRKLQRQIRELKLEVQSLGNALKESDEYD